ncbi:hypothetical protein ES705_47125 [subsurface metagenome]
MMEDFFKITGNYFFPLVLSGFLIYRIDRFLTMVTKEMKEIKETQTKILFFLQVNCTPKK